MQTNDAADVSVNVTDTDSDGDNEYVIAISEDGDRAWHVEPRYRQGINVIWYASPSTPGSTAAIRMRRERSR